MNISEYKRCIRICRKARVPLMVWGPGGMGKTSGAKQVSDEDQCGFVPLQGSLLNPVDLLGLPDRENGRTVWSRPEILPTDGSGIILVDEISDSTMTMMKAYYQLILSNTVQSHIIPDDWYIMGAGNRAIDSHATNTMPAPLITRLTHIGVGCDAPDFTDDTPKTAVIDVDDFMDYAIHKFNPLVTAFLKFQSKYIYRHQAVPRTWENASKLLDSHTDHFEYVFSELMRGTVGAGVGTEFNGFIKMASKIPSLQAIITNPMSVDIPSELQIIFATVTALIHKTDSSTASNIITFVNRLSNEMQFFYFASVRTGNQDIVANPDYIKWMNENKEVLI
jgi:hypothetical protein